MIEVGRHKKIPKSERYCPFCSNLVEDQVHFLVICPTYTHLRNDLSDLCTKLNPNFPHYTDLQKFVFILTNEHMTIKVSKFLYLAMELRKNLLKDGT